jgi:RsmE family RNA methyltransferase
VLLALGPEGGWNDFERRLLESRGFTPISMGMRTLRSDTACVALLALAHDALGSVREASPRTDHGPVMVREHTGAPVS